MESLFHEIRVAVRSLFRRRMFALVAISTLALGIGANAIMLSVAHGVLLRPLPYPESDRLVNLFRLAEDVTGMNPSNANIAGLYSVPYPLYLDWAERGRVFEQIGAYAGATYTVTGAEFPVRAEGIRATSGMFAALGIPPALGRTFAPEDDRPGAPAQVVLGHAFWSSFFGSDPTVLGRDLPLNGAPYTIVGVMPEGFGFPDDDTDLWVTPDEELKTQTFRAGGNLQVIARLREGVSVADAQRTMDGVARDLGELHPEEREHGVRVVGNQELIVAGIRPTLYLFAGALALVLLVICANLAGLLLVRGLERRREIAVRAALGAGRARLALHVLTEGLVLALVGGAAGLALAAAGLGPFLRTFPGNLPRASELGLDPAVPLIAGGLALVTGLLSGLVPAIRLARGAGATLRGTGGPSSAGRAQSRAQSLLVIAQIAMSFALLVAAGAFIVSFARLSSDELGFDPEGIVTLRIVLPEPYREPESRSAQFFRDLEESIAAIPGVERIGRSSQAPFIDGLSSPPTEVELDGETVTESVHSSNVTPAYFDVMGIPLLRGRMLAETDQRSAPAVALVSEAFARTYWPDQDPLGRRVRLELGDDELWPWMTVVGVVGNLHYSYGGSAMPELYIPYEQDNGIFYQTLLVRSALPPGELVEAARAAVRDVDREVFVRTGVYADAVNGSRSLSRPRFAALAIGGLGLVAAALAVLGLYAVLAFSVIQRRHEIGIRMALGAQQHAVVGNVLRRGLRLGIAGLVGGLAITLAAGRVVGALLYDTSPTDTMILVAMAVVLLGAALAASYLPARRATRVSPVESLRGESR